MKKAVLIAAAGLMAVSAFAALDVYDTVNYKSVSDPALVTGSGTNAGTAYNAATTNLAVDVSGIHGIAAVVLSTSGGITNSGTATVTLQAGATSTGTFATVTNCTLSASTASTKVVRIDGNALPRYVRAVYSVPADSASVGAVLIYTK